MLRLTTIRIIKCTIECELPDWNILIPNLLRDTSNLSFQDAYLLGDIDNNDQVGMEDFLAFRQTWETLYGTAALAQLTTSVPEPSTGNSAFGCDY